MRKMMLVGLCMLGSVAASHAEAREINVVASFTILGDIAQEIGGEHVKVTNLVGPNGDPHVYEPTPQDGQALKAADVVLVSGLGMEGWMDRLIKASGYRGKVVTTSDGIQTRMMEEDGKEITDPHAWNSAANGVIYAQNVTRALAAADPEDAKNIADRGQAYEARLQEIDRWAKQEIGSVPAARRKVITSHDAFGYLGARYGITFLAPEGVSTETEASAADVAELIDQMKKAGIKVVFIENSNDPRLVQQIAREADGKLGGELYPESLTVADGPAPTYLQLLRYNIEQLKKGMLAQ
jgi:zinc/manganese transport system substrate-binding protein